MRSFAPLASHDNKKTDLKRVVGFLQDGVVRRLDVVDQLPRINMLNKLQRKRITHKGSAENKKRLKKDPRRKQEKEEKKSEHVSLSKLHQEG